MQEDELAAGVWRRGFDGLYGLEGLVLGACCAVDLGIFGVEDLGDLLAQACVCSGDDVDLGCWC